MPEGSQREVPPQSPWVAVATALALDAADLVTFGPVGLWTGLLLGGVLGWSLAPQLGFGDRRWLPSLLAGAYCMLPGTALLPLATVLTGARAFSDSQRAAPPAVGPDESRRDPGAIEADYRARWDDDDSRPRAD